jgi:hypothetical protein
VRTVLREVDANATEEEIDALITLMTRVGHSFL